MKKLAVVTVLVAAVTAVLWRARDASDYKLLYDRFWIDHAPNGPREQFLSLFVHGDHPAGHVGKQTMWKGAWEAFHYHVVPREDGVIDLIFPETGEKERQRYTARACSENGFDFCLEISGGTRIARRYYSKKGWDSKHAALPFAPE